MKEVEPILSLAERDRRYRVVREWMKASGLDCLIVAGCNGELIDIYFSNDSANAIVVFPLESEPIYLVWSASRVIRMMEYSQRGVTPWIEDYRVGSSGVGLVDALKSKGLESATIGHMGVDTQGAGEPDGWVAYNTWAYVLEHLPKATFVDVTYPLAEIMLVKSEEELALARHSARIGEMACEALLKATKLGANEREIFASTLKVIFANGAGSRLHILAMQTGVDNASWGEPMWLRQAQRPHFLQEGEMVGTEIFTVYGGIETQNQMAVSLKPVDPANRKCAEVARKAYEVGLKTIAPGKMFSEVANAMEVPIAEAGCWHLDTTFHTLNPLVWCSLHNVRISQMPGIEKYKDKGIKEEPFVQGQPDLTLRPGMILQLEPNAGLGKHRVSIGSSVIVTEEGAEELSKLSTEMRVAD
jgi:Xaa-Pro aminopeptidase